MPATGNGGAAVAACASRNRETTARRLRKRTIAIARRGSLLRGVAFPVFQARTREACRTFPNFCHLFRRHGLELLRDPDVIFDLPNGGASQRQAVNRQA